MMREEEEKKSWKISGIRKQQGSDDVRMELFTVNHPFSAMVCG